MARPVSVDINKIREMFVERKMRICDIAREFGMVKSAITYHLFKMGLKKKKCGTYNDYLKAYLKKDFVRDEVGHLIEIKKPHPV
jgi:hypothetical protein